MFDLPEHCPIDVDENGNGPATGVDIVATVCWCGTPLCMEYLTDQQ